MQKQINLIISRFDYKHEYVFESNDIMNVNGKWVKQISFYFIKNRCVGTVCVFNDNTSTKLNQLSKYMFKCKECGKMEERKILTEKHIKNGIICISCRSQNHNPFKGKKHSQTLKDRFSRERKGKWGVGEKNSMYDEKLKDHMTDEKYQKWKLKRAQIDFSGEKNPMYGKV